MNPTKLIKNGFNVVPIGEAGQPLVKNIRQVVDGKPTPITFTEGQAEHWHKLSNISGYALVAGINQVAWLDIDIDNQAMATAIKKWLLKRFPTLPIRTCNPPRFAVLMRVDDSLQACSGGISNQYKIDADTSCIIEFGAWLRLITLYGTHRKTGKPYRWVANSPKTHSYLDLPVMSKKDVSELFAFMAALVKKHFSSWQLVGPAKLHRIVKKPRSGTAMENAQVTKSFTDEQVEKLLVKYNGDTRNGWRTAGMALHAHYKGNMAGLAMWDLWSQGFDKYETGACAEEWGGFESPEERGGGVTMQTLNASVKHEEKHPHDIAAHYLERYVLIEQGQRLADLQARVGEEVLFLKDARVSLSNERIEYTLKNGEIKSNPAISTWLTDPERKTAFDTLFVPGEKSLCANIDLMGSGKQYWNTYVPPSWDVTKYERKHAITFTDHVKYLFGDEKDGAKWFISWLAQMIQCPQERLTIAPVHISTETGTGRGWLVLLINKLVGHRNVAEVDIDTMTSKTKKNGYLSESIFCSVPEVRETSGQARYAVANTLKKQITDLYLNVDVKYGKEGLLRIYTRFFFQSNHQDAIVIDDTDRRFNVFANHKKPLSPKRYKELYDLLLDETFMGSVYSYLSDFKYDNAFIMTILNTQARKRMMNSTKSPTAQGFLALKSIVDVVTYEQMTDFIHLYRQMHDGGSTMGSDNDKELRHLIKEYVRTDQIVNGQKLYSFLNISDNDTLAQKAKLSVEIINTYFN